MKRSLAIFPLLLLMVACSKKPDAPTPAAVQPTPGQPQPPAPPPVTNCQGATVMYSLPTGQTVNDNSSKAFTIPNFEQSCGDTLSVFFRAAGITPAPAWTPLTQTTDNGATYYSVLNQVVTFHNRTGIVLEVDIEAVLK